MCYDGIGTTAPDAVNNVISGNPEGHGLTGFQRSEKEAAINMLTSGTDWTTAVTDLINGIIAIIPIV